MEAKQCPRCGTPFICRHDNPAQCQCAGIGLTSVARSYIAEQYPSQCLCANCLREFASSFS